MGDRLTDTQRDALVKAREACGLTRVQLAVKLGVHPDTVRRWEEGISGPSPMAKRAIQKRFPAVFTE